MDWAVYTPDFLFNLENIFLGHTEKNSQSEVRMLSDQVFWNIDHSKKTTSKILICNMICLHLFLYLVVLICVIHIIFLFVISSSYFPVYDEPILCNVQLPVFFQAQLVRADRCTGIAEVRDRIPGNLKIFRLSFGNCVSCDGT